MNADNKHIAIEQITRSTIITEEAAHYLNRSTQTLRKWARNKNGPIQAIKINGRLAWSVREIQALLAGGEL